jgi:photosystem II stability/assembly factor-like uncharacterized protein
MLTWTASPGVDYWIFSDTDPGLTAFNVTGLNQYIHQSAATPFYMCGLFNGTLSNGTVSPLPYYFAANGRINGGPGGPSSPTISAAPYNASAAAWTIGSTPLSSNLYGVGYASLTTCANNATSATGIFVAVGASGAIFTSTDGQGWTPYAPPTSFSTDLYAVTGYTAYLNNPSNPGLRWVAVGAGGASIYSLDGLGWYVGNPYNSASSANPNNYALRSITHVGGTFYAVGDVGTILSSTDGITWTSHTSGTANNLNGVNHGTNYVAVGNSGTILTSGDGNTWTAHTLSPAITSNLRQVTSVGSIIVAVGDTGTIVTSKDGGATWTAQTLTSAPNLVGVAAESQFVENAVADTSLGFIANAQFVAIDRVGNAYTSPNGLTWSNPVSTGTTSLNALVSSGFGYVSAGNAGATAYAF